MNRIWKTHRGDEWWYEDYWCKASASRAANIVSISYVHIVQGQLNVPRLHEFLSLTWKRFEGEAVLLNVSNADVLKNLSRLAELGIVSFEERALSYSKEVKLTAVQHYEKPESSVKTEKRKWWKLW